MPNLYDLPQEERTLEWLNKRDPTRVSVSSTAYVWVPRGVAKPDVVVVPAALSIAGLNAEVFAEGVATGEPPPPVEEWPFPSCPLQATFPWARANQMYDDQAGSSGTEDGFFFASNGSIVIVRPGSAPGQTGVENESSGILYQKAKSDSLLSDLPHDAVYGIAHQNVAGGVAAWSSWNYIAFDPTDTDWWVTHPIQVDLINFSEDLFNPALGNGIEICCAAGAGDPGNETFRDWMTYPNGALASAANWNDHPAFSGMTVDGNIAYAPSAGVFAAAILSSLTPGNDQWVAAEIRVWHVIGAGTNPRRAGVLLRYDPVAQTGYVCYAYKNAGGGGGFAGPGGTRIEKHVAGVVTTLVDVPDVPDTSSWVPEEISAEVIGTTIRVLRNGEVVATATDAAIASGSLGLYLWSDATSNVFHNALQTIRAGSGPAPRRTIDGHHPGVFNWGRFLSRATHAGNPAALPAVGEVMAHITSPAQLPFTLPNPQGRALIIRTKNQDPQTLPLGTNILHDVNVGFQLDDPAGAYKQLRSDQPTHSSGMWTVKTAAQLRIRAVARETLFGPSFLYSRGVLIYRDPVRFVGNTLRVSISSPFIWLAEDPALTYLPGGMTATLTAFAVDESDLIGTSVENFAIYRALDWNGLQTRLGAEIAHVDFLTASSDSFLSGAGNFDVSITGGKKLVWYELTASAQPGNPNAGLHLPAINHSNPSIF